MWMKINSLKSRLLFFFILSFDIKFVLYLRNKIPKNNRNERNIQVSVNRIRLNTVNYVKKETQYPVDIIVAKDSVISSSMFEHKSFSQQPLNYS